MKRLLSCCAIAAERHWPGLLQWVVSAGTGAAQRSFNINR